MSFGLLIQFTIPTGEMDGDQMAGVVMTVHADRGKIVAIRMENGYSLLPDRRERGTLRLPLPEWAVSANSDIPGWISLADIRSELVRATVDLGWQGY